MHQVIVVSLHFLKQLQINIHALYIQFLFENQKNCPGGMSNYKSFPKPYY